MFSYDLKRSHPYDKTTICAFGKSPKMYLEVETLKNNNNHKYHYFDETRLN